MVSRGFLRSRGRFFFVCVSRIVRVTSDVHIFFGKAVGDVVIIVVVIGILWRC